MKAFIHSCLSETRVAVKTAELGLCKRWVWPDIRFCSHLSNLISCLMILKDLMKTSQKKNLQLTKMLSNTADVYAEDGIKTST